MEGLGCFHNTDQCGFPSIHKIGLMKVLPKRLMVTPRNFFQPPRSYNRPTYETLSLTLRVMTGLMKGPSFYLFEHLLQFSHSYLSISLTRQSSRHSSLCSLTCNLRWSNGFAATLGPCKLLGEQLLFSLKFKVRLLVLPHTASPSTFSSYQ